MVSVPLMTHCGPGDVAVVVPALEHCAPQLSRGVVGVCRQGGGVVIGAAEAGGAGGRCRGLVQWPVPTVMDGPGLLGGPSPLGLVVGVWSIDV